MLFPNDKDDDDFGSLSGNSSLPSLFEDTMSSKSSSKSLTYMAPKQLPPRITSSQPSPNVLAAAAVNCYKLTNDKYEPLQGKVGLAILGNSEINHFQMVLYQTKQKPISSVKITAEFMFSSQPDNFCSFYDDQRQNWAVLFDSKEIVKKFIDEIENIKLKLSGGKEKPVQTEIKDQIDDKIEPPVNVEKTETTKTRLISRIAKMGQPILPLAGAAVASNSDSDDAAQSPSETDNSTQTNENTKPKSKPRLPTSKPIPKETVINSMIVPTHMNNIPSYPVMQYVPAVNIGGSSSHFDILLSETRTQNSEIRMHLCRLTDKIDHILLQKLPMPEMLPRPQATEDITQQLLHYCQDLQKESSIQIGKLDRILETLAKKEALKDNLQLQDYYKKEMESSICQRDVLANQVEEAKKKIEQLENEKEQLCVELKETEIKYNNLQAEQLSKEKSEAWKSQEKLEMYESKCAHLESKFQQLDSFCEEKKQENTELKQQIQKMGKERNDYKTLAETLQMKLTNLEEEARQKLHNSQETNEKIKRIMNKVYKLIVKQFQEDETYSFHSIKSTVSQIIRDVTLTMINDGRENAVSNDAAVKEDLQPAKENLEATKDVMGEVKENTPSESGENAGQLSESNETKERSLSLLESLHSSLAAAQSRNGEQVWKPEPPPPPLFDDFNNEDDWLM